jgi:hypothetical protein
MSCILTGLSDFLQGTVLGLDGIEGGMVQEIFSTLKDGRFRDDPERSGSASIPKLKIFKSRTLFGSTICL